MMKMLFFFHYYDNYKGLKKCKTLLTHTRENLPCHFQVIRQRKASTGLGECCVNLSVAAGQRYGAVCLVSPEQRGGQSRHSAALRYTLRSRVRL